MSNRSPLFGRRIHITGSIAADAGIAPAGDVDQARAVVDGLVRELVRKGATFVVPVDAEKLRSGDNRPICFDWLVWQALNATLARRPSGAPTPLAVAVQHHKTEAQIPAEFEGLWDELRGSDLVQIENVSHWNMNSKRMEAQAKAGDILITLGGSEGVLFLANLYHDAGKPVVPLNFPLGAEDTGARKLFAMGLSSSQASRLFRSTSQSAHHWINRINFTQRATTTERVRGIIELLEALEKPRAFAVRLLNPKHEDYAAVQDFFDIVVQPVVENELGFSMTVVDGEQPFEHGFFDQEIFAKLHRSSVVVADITGSRPNCFLELGYALGRCHPTMLTAKEGTFHPSDIQALGGLHWSATGTVDRRREAFRKHWNAIRTRPPLVPMEPLIW
ncbi:hypothetical protein [Hyphomicrobium zavarzinii]|uniref:hypothetical protein n=1 Tax=Hyphomicrobium zavarzinii TaxID=48292 RepID=UPI0003720127|nr:hypothetical protein [Hyphomicrobium zavarzinii]